VSKPDWSRPLAKRIDIGRARKLRTLAAVRMHLLQVPEERQTNVIWQKMIQDILDAAESGDTLDLTIPFALARMMRH
jgi:hypothetical protein